MLDDLESGARTPRGPAILALQACAATESSWSWCGEDDVEGATFFAEGLELAFTKATEEMDENGDGWISFQEAYQVAVAYVELIVKAAIGAGKMESSDSQTPVIRDSIGEPVNVVEVKD